MSLLARSDAPFLEQALSGLPEAPRFSFLRAPEYGLAMLRGRAGNTGQPFNLGEMTVTRCAVRLENGVVGMSYIAGRKRRHAELAAIFDAMFQEVSEPLCPQGLCADMFAKILSRIQAERARVAAQSAATRVDFFTLARGDE